MELSFKIPAWLEFFLSTQGYIELWTMFGTIFTAVLLAVILAYIDKITKRDYLIKLFTPLIRALTVTWILGFLVIISMGFTSISIAQRFLIWCVMFVGFLIFSIVKRKALNKYFDET